jgi:hypothetical protein
MAEGKIMMLHAGLAVIWPSSVYDTHAESFKTPPILAISSGAVVISIGQVNLSCNLELIEHLIEHGPDLFFYEDGGEPLLLYYGALQLVRDRLLELKGALLYSLNTQIA